MNTSFTSKLAALTLALMVNSVIIGGVAVIFSDRAQGYTVSAVTATQAPQTVQGPATAA